MNVRRAIGPNGEVDIINLHPIYADTFVVQSDHQATYGGYTLLGVDEITLKRPRPTVSTKTVGSVPLKLIPHIIPPRG